LPTINLLIFFFLAFLLFFGDLGSWHFFALPAHGQTVKKKAKAISEKNRPHTKVVSVTACLSVCCFSSFPAFLFFPPFFSLSALKYCVKNNPNKTAALSATRNFPPSS
jgi:hypothetical protein